MNISFTELAHTNRFTLNILNPSNCEEKVIKDPRKSVLNTLESAQGDIYNNPEKTTDKLYAAKTLRMVARAVYAVAVSVIVAPVGVVFHGTRLAFALAHWCFTVNDAGNETWQKVKEVAEVWHTDFSTALIGLGLLLLAGVIVECVIFYPLIEGLSYASIPAAGIVYLTQPYNHAYYIANLVAYPEEKASLYISLAVRERLGITGQNGGLLPHNEKDGITSKSVLNQYGRPTYICEGPAVIMLPTLILRAEEELLYTVCEAKDFLQRYNIKLEYEYYPRLTQEKNPSPLSGYSVASEVSDAIQSVQTEKPSEELNELKKRYQQIGLAIHPDKKMGREKEATILFKTLGDIYTQLLG